MQFDVASEATKEVLVLLRSLKLHESGTITIDRIDMALSEQAAVAEAAVPGHSNEAVIWEEVESRVRDESTVRFSRSGWCSVCVLLAVCPSRISAASWCLWCGHTLGFKKCCSPISLINSLRRLRKPRLFRRR